MPAPVAAAPVAAGAGKAAATKAALAAGAMSAAGGVASGIASGLMTPDSKERDPKSSIPGASPGQVGARPAGSNLFAGRQELSSAQPRNSLALQLLSKGGYR